MARFETGWVDGSETGQEKVDGFKPAEWEGLKPAGGRRRGNNQTTICQFQKLAGWTLMQYWLAYKV